MATDKRVNVSRPNIAGFSRKEITELIDTNKQTNLKLLCGEWIAVNKVGCRKSIDLIYDSREIMKMVCSSSVELDRNKS